MVPVTVRKPFRLVCFTRLDFSLVEMSFSCFKVMLMPWPPIGSDLTLSVFRISMASSLALILIKVGEQFTNITNISLNVSYIICNFGKVLSLSLVAGRAASPCEGGSWGRGRAWMFLTLSSSLLSTTLMLSSSSPLVWTLADLLRLTAGRPEDSRDPPSLRLLFWWTASRTRSMSVLLSDSCKHPELLAQLQSSTLFTLICWALLGLLEPAATAIKTS